MTLPAGASFASAERSLGPLADGGRRARVALVLGSGGIKCAAAMGLWKVLAREQVPIDVAVGCSGGAIYAALVALGADPTVYERRTLALWSDLFSRPHYRSVARALFPRLLGFDEHVGLLDDRRVTAVLRETFGDATFADARIPLHIAATDFTTGEKVVLDAGRVVDAVRASVSIPLLLRPWEVGGRLLVDGGASNPLPVDVGIREGCDIILAMGFENQMVETVETLANALSRTTTIVTNHLLRATFAFYGMAHHAELIPLIPQLDRRVRLTDASAVPYLIEQGERVAEEQLPYLRRLLAASGAERQ